MKKILFFLVFSIVFTSNVYSAEKNSSNYYDELVINYRKYQSQVEPFNIKKSRYLSNQSVDNQAELLTAARNLLVSEIEAILSYSNFTRAMLVEGTKVLNYQENYIFIKLDDEISFLTLQKSKAAGLGSLGEAQILATALKEHYSTISQMGYQTKAIIE